jgi:hypothetical protein
VNEVVRDAAHAEMFSHGVPTRESPAQEERPPAGNPIFVGRELELSKLKGHLDAALAGRGQIRSVTAQAGSDKTYLVRHFVE